MPKLEVRNEQKKGFALYVLQFKRLRWSQKLIKNGGPNGIKNPLKFKFGSKGAFLEICVDFGWLVCRVLGGRRKAKDPHGGDLPGLEGIALGPGSMVGGDIYIYI